MTSCFIAALSAIAPLSPRKQFTSIDMGASVPPGSKSLGTSFFPKGITMAVDASAVAEGIAKGIFGATAADAPLVVVLPAGIVEGVEKQRAERREKKERMN